MYQLCDVYNPLIQRLLTFPKKTAIIYVLPDKVQKLKQKTDSTVVNEFIGVIYKSTS